MKKETSSHVLDFCILFFLFAFCVGLLARADSYRTHADPSAFSDATLSFEIQGMDGDLLAAFLEEENVYLQENGAFLGTMQRESLQISPARLMTRDANGNTVITHSERRYDITGQLSLQGVFGKSGFLANGTTYLAPNMTLSLHSRHVRFSFYVTEISPIPRG